MERRWNDADREKLRTRRKNCHSTTLLTTNPTWIDLVTNPGLSDDRPATNRVSNGTTCMLQVVCVKLKQMMPTVFQNDSRIFTVPPSLQSVVLTNIPKSTHL
jgi:hypothetical protein